MIKPIHTLATLLAVGALCFITIVVFPEEGIRITDDFKLQFATLSDYQAAQDEEFVEPIEDIEEFLDVYTMEVDSIAIKDSLLRIEVEMRQELMKIQFKDDNPDILNSFFSALEKTKKDGSSTRVLHYGDSQIEGDRITGYIRNELQKEFGGTGPGLLPAYEVIPSLAIDQTASENWNRYTVFGRRDTLVTHKRYGVLANFNSFVPVAADSLNLDTTLKTAWISYKPSRLTYNRAKKYNNVHMFLGHNSSDVELNTYLGDSLISFETISANESVMKKTWNFASTPSEIKFEFIGVESPEVYAVSLESSGGVHVDNIAMRGSSGTIFKKIDRAQLKKQYGALGVKLFILQFGGNTVPYITSLEKAERYGRWFKAQIDYLKSMVPDASIIVIGPSDMSVKDKDKFVTRPYLEEVRDALKEAAYDTGCGFWDIYEVMGGRNSMKSWVEADPPLAGKDYTHFTPKGARRISELFYTSLKEQYEAWKLQKDG